MTVAARDLGAALDQVLPAASRDPEQPVLTCVLAEGRDGSLRLAATDRYRLAVRDIVPAGGPGASFRELVPAPTLRRWRSELPEDGEVSVGVRDDHLVVSGGGVDLRAQQVAGTFPAYETMLERRREAHAVVVRRDALHAAFMTFARAVAGPGDRDEAGDEGAGGGAVLVSAGRDCLTLVRRGDEVTIDADHGGPDLHVALDPVFAAEAVAAAVGPDVVVEISDALQPVVFRSADDGTFTTMVMPVRLD